MNKISRLIALVAVLFCTATIKADIYSDGLKTLVENQVIPNLNLGDINKLGGIDNVVEKIAPYYRDNMSEAEFTKMVNYYQNPKFLAISSKISEKSKASIEQFVPTMMSTGMQIAQGGSAANIEAKECSAEFKAAYDRYYRVSGADGILTSLEAAFNEMSKNLPSQASAMFTRLLDYMKVNIPTFTRNMMVDSVTVEELNYLCEVEKESFYAPMMKAQDAMMKSLPSFAQSFIR